MTLSIIIVSYNTKQLTLECLESIATDLKNYQKLGLSTEIIMVDNHSTDGSVTAVRDFLRKTSLRYLIIENKDNLGFAKANNQAIKRARGTYLLLLNSDTLVQSGALQHLVDNFTLYPIDNQTAQAAGLNGPIDRLGLVAAQLYNSDGSIQPQGGSLPTLWSLFFHMTFLDDLPIIGQLLPSTQHTGWRARQNRDSDRNNNDEAQPKLLPQGWVGATALLVRKRVFDEIDPFDENIFMYGEDVELCMRARHHHWDIAIDPGAHITHLGSASSSSAKAIEGELLAYVYIFSKHKPAWQVQIVSAIIQLGCILRMMIFGTMGNHTAVTIYKNTIQKIRQQ